MDRNSRSVNLICFPYAGGSKYSFNSFKSVASSEIKVIPIELPGRGERLTAPLLTDISSMADDLFGQLKEHINKPYVIYGHSMGALLGYLVTKTIYNSNLPLPLHLIVTGCEGPSVKDETIKMRSQLPPDAFVAELKSMGGIPDEVLNNESFLSLFEPILRADFHAIEGYTYLKTPPLNIPICVIYGSEEDISVTEALAWQEESNFDVEVLQLPGGHFFIFKHERQIIKIVEEKIRQSKTKSSYRGQI